MITNNSTSIPSPSSDISSDQDEMFDGATATFVVLWSFAFLVFICLPCCFSKARRTNWSRRIRQRRWNVELAVHEDPSWYVAATRRYEERRAREAAENNNNNTRRPSKSFFSKAEKEEIRQNFLSEQLSKYTKILDKKDFTKKISCIVDDKSEETGKSITNIDEEMGTVINSSNNADDEKLTEEDTCIDYNNRDMSEIGDTDNHHHTNVKDKSIHEEVVSLSFSAEKDDDGINIFESGEYIKVPFAGVDIALLANNDNDDEDDSNCRDVPNGCAICLCSFSAGDSVTWSANDQCPHVFHQECILDWMLAVGRKKKRRRRQNPSDSSNDNNQTVDGGNNTNGNDNGNDATEESTNEERQRSGGEEQPSAGTSETEDGNEPDVTSEMAKVIDFPMLCPCCRQRFVYKGSIKCLTATETGSSVADLGEALTGRDNDIENV